MFSKNIDFSLLEIIVQLSNYTYLYILAQFIVLLYHKFTAHLCNDVMSTSQCKIRGGGQIRLVDISLDSIYLELSVNRYVM